MVEIAKAIKNNSRIVVFDEPSAVLGVKDSEILFSEIDVYKRQVFTSGRGRNDFIHDSAHVDAGKDVYKRQGCLIIQWLS